MAGSAKNKSVSEDVSRSSRDPVRIAARLLNLVLDMPIEQQLKLLNLCDKWNYNGVRKHPRKKWAIPVCLESERSTFKESITDISKGGLYIETQTSFSIDQEVKLNFQLPTRPNPIKVFGKIVRVTSRGVGIEFKRYST